jgi:hypothetical protein
VQEVEEDVNEEENEDDNQETALAVPAPRKRASGKKPAAKKAPAKKAAGSPAASSAGAWVGAAARTADGLKFFTKAKASPLSFFVVFSCVLFAGLLLGLLLSLPRGRALESRARPGAPAAQGPRTAG